jgi:UDP-N-acetylmuramoyl-tripeptide--D-alanyl-D-alanine ligase
MENLFLNELIESTRGEFLLGSPHAVVKNISTDSRTVRKGDFFFAIKGKNYDGHDFLRDAVNRQAAGLVVSKKELDLGSAVPDFPSVVKVADTTRALGDLAGYYRRKFNLKVIGITGSNGKTTTKLMLSSILNLSAPCLSNTKNFNNQLGVPLTLMGLSGEHRFAVIEMGTSYPGEIARLCEIAGPDAGILTNIGYSHLENFKDPRGVYKEKIKLLESLPAEGFGVVNFDDDFLREVSRDYKSNIISFGIDSKADIVAEDVKLWPDLPSFTLRLGGDLINVRLPVNGKFNIYNALAAAACAWKLGIGSVLIKKGLEKFKPEKMRMETIKLVSGAVIVNDSYNANPSSMRAAITAFVQAFPDKEKIVVLGDMLELGETSEQEHASLGGFLALQPLHRIFLYGPLMAKAGEKLESAQFSYFEDKDELAEQLRSALSQDSVAFVKGSRGMKLEEVVEKIVSGE